MSRFLAFALLALAACELPPLTLKFRLTDGPTQTCYDDKNVETTDCSDITLACRAVLSLRIVPPNEPEFPYVSLCEPLVGGQNKLCALAGIDLPQPNRPVPEQVLEVQVAVFQRDQLATDDDGKPICPRVDFAANGLPRTSVDCTGGDCPVRPAVGGRAFYYPGDEETVLELGCTDITLLTSQTCEGPPKTEVIATVNDFDNWVPIEATTANRLTVSIGEPKGDVDAGFSLVSALPLPRATMSPPTWGAQLDFKPQSTYCVEVSEDVPQATRSLVCRQVSIADPIRIDALGALLSKTTLTDVLKAKGRTTFPEQGLVIGAVLDDENNPVGGAVVSAQCPIENGCHIEYLSADRQSFAGDKTSANGIWISTDAPYGTIFDRSAPVAFGFGGLVQGKVTIVVLQQSSSTGG